jgi:hypothetical protein
VCCAPAAGAIAAGPQALSATAKSKTIETIRDLLRIFSPLKTLLISEPKTPPAKK